LVFVLEHWFQVFHGHQAPFQLLMFYPDKLALGYSDALFLLAIPYSLFRLVGFDYFSSYKLLFFFMTSVGYFGAHLMLSKVFKCTLYFSLTGAVLLTFLNSLHVHQAGHGQLLSFYFYPILVYLLYTFFAAENKRGVSAWVSIMTFSILLGLIFFTSYYPAWFFAFSLIIFSLLYVIVGFCSNALTFRKLLSLWKESRSPLLGALIVFVATLTPFFLTYLPVVASGFKSTFEEMLVFAPHVKDIINVGTGNWIWSRLLGRLQFGFGNYETQMGSPIITLAMFIVSVILLLWRRERKVADTTDRIVVALACTAVLLFLLVVKVDHYSLWWCVEKMVPGALAIRALGRALIVFDMAEIIVIMYVLNKHFVANRKAWGTASRTPFLTMVLAFLVLVPMILVADQTSHCGILFDKDPQIALLKNTPRRELAQYDAFFVTNGDPRLPFYMQNIDAMLIAMDTGIPTVNGYSGYFPDPVFAKAPSGYEYEEKVRAWLKAREVRSRICALDLKTRQCEPIDLYNQQADTEREAAHRYLSEFTSLYVSVTKFFAAGHKPEDLYPQFLETHGFLDPSYGYGSGVANNWTGDHRIWIGPRFPVGQKGRCFGIGMLGKWKFLKEIMREYGGAAVEAYYPYPRPYVEGTDQESGELLIVFQANSK
jgi:hypothetical protein